MVSETNKAFNSALVRVLKYKKHGAQTEMAEAIGISPQYLSDLLNGRKRWLDRLKDKVADYLGRPVSDLIRIGEVLMETGAYFPYIREVQVMRQHSEERAEWIAKRAGLDAGLGDIRFLSVPSLKVWLYGTIEPYLAGRMDDAHFYEDILAISCKILKTCLFEV